MKKRSLLLNLAVSFCTLGVLIVPVLSDVGIRCATWIHERPRPE